jgi:hypothetical protein
MGTVGGEAGTDVKMDKSPHRSAGRSDTRRAEAFSDSVFSIIITLLAWITMEAKLGNNHSCNPQIKGVNYRHFLHLSR